MRELSEGIRERLAAPDVWFVATTGPDGAPHVSPMWMGLDGDNPWFNTSVGRVKLRNLRHDPRVCLSHHAEPFDRIQIHGRVARFVEGPKAERDMDRLAHKYLGTPYEWLLPGEQRVTVVIEPLRVRRVVGVEPFGPR
ncbi:TIGR03618 family F420-dependent PPOX class oxidoreductase [Streptomyces pathocidini]|uniref:TIGR03618 family F420-dependent PPOX class oxidoreductase n=1 Tax=Streptomyces pathocidini TaxID=1650571 RepID=A0ABW7UKJ6_9ACTN|nr:TIGR03618 family F420-dependent PPOX class oxidoreductase [Streptomyces pathocidini]